MNPQRLVYSSVQADFQVQQPIMDDLVVYPESLDKLIPQTSGLGTCETVLDVLPLHSEAIFSVDAVLHNRCHVSHMRFYSSLRLSNYGATRELTSLVLPRVKP
ncbi:hypothetical protein MCOR25_010387 [Pyricularia grisea]|uniref:Uncharacterized protein n=1 Tax=Pyricularia grisea TaxID=148305 RepID=A0A6P8BB80_PYRGI|nr:uncharacterized protein PgNI_02865 [Pyricularia grisea]KAI6350790.1 hypothetical protein MCOR25_010387 [Pyricularia grisea]TLD12952.1 hypothetical protein PgNI_02865 [Pyricularia grisea]